MVVKTAVRMDVEMDELLVVETVVQMAVGLVEQKAELMEVSRVDKRVEQRVDVMVE